MEYSVLLMVFTQVLLFALSITTTPGPNNIMLIASSVNWGVMRTLPHALGIIVGVPMVVGLAALGLSQIILANAWLYRGIQLLGAGYLIFLAWKIATATGRINASSTAAAPNTKGQPITFFQALVFQWANPKNWLAVTGTASLLGTVDDQLIVVSVVTMAFFCAAIVSCSLWTIGGRQLSRWLEGGNRRIWFNRVMGLLLVGSLGMLIV